MVSSYLEVEESADLSGDMVSAITCWINLVGWSANVSTWEDVPVDAVLDDDMAFDHPCVISPIKKLLNNFNYFYLTSDIVIRKLYHR